MAAESWSGIEGLESERLGGSRANDFKDIDIHAQTEQLEFVDQRDVYATIDVLEQFGHFRRCRRRDRNYAIED